MNSITIIDLFTMGFRITLDNEDDARTPTLAITAATAT